MLTPEMHSTILKQFESFGILHQSVNMTKNKASVKLKHMNVINKIQVPTSNNAKDNYSKWTIKLQLSWHEKFKAQEIKTTSTKILNKQMTNN